MDPTGKFAYVVNDGASTVAGYTINPTTGALKPIDGSPFAAGATATSVAADPSGEFAYVLIFSGVSGYTINATTGALTLVPGSPFAGGYGYYAQSVAVDPSGKFTYAVYMWDNRAFSAGDVHGDTIDATTGALTPIPGSPFPAPGWSTSIAVSGEIH